MGKKFSGLELSLIVLFSLVTVILCVLIGLLATGQSGVKSPGKCFPQLLEDQNPEWDLLSSDSGSLFCARLYPKMNHGQNFLWMIQSKSPAMNVINGVTQDLLS